MGGLVCIVALVGAFSGHCETSSGGSKWPYFHGLLRALKPRERLLLHYLLLLLISLPGCWCCALLRRPGELWCNSCSLSGGLLATGADTATDLHTPHSRLRASHIFFGDMKYYVHFVLYYTPPRLCGIGKMHIENRVKGKIISCNMEHVRIYIERTKCLINLIYLNHAFNLQNCQNGRQFALLFHTLNC